MLLNSQWAQQYPNPVAEIETQFHMSKAEFLFLSAQT